MRVVSVTLLQSANAETFTHLECYCAVLSVKAGIPEQFCQLNHFEVKYFLEIPMRSFNNTFDF